MRGVVSYRGFVIWLYLKPHMISRKCKWCEPTHMLVGRIRRWSASWAPRTNEKARPTGWWRCDAVERNGKSL